jgi:hypothetical protein
MKSPTIRRRMNAPYMRVQPGAAYALGRFAPSPRVPRSHYDPFPVSIAVGCPTSYAERVTSLAKTKVDFCVTEEAGSCSKK